MSNAPIANQGYDYYETDVLYLPYTSKKYISSAIDVAMKGGKAFRFGCNYDFLSSSKSHAAKALGDSDEYKMPELGYLVPNNYLSALINFRPGFVPSTEEELQELYNAVEEQIKLRVARYETAGYSLKRTPEGLLLEVFDYVPPGKLDEAIAKASAWQSTTIWDCLTHTEMTIKDDYESSNLTMSSKLSNLLTRVWAEHGSEDAYIHELIMLLSNLIGQLSHMRDSKIRAETIGSRGRQYYIQSYRSNKQNVLYSICRLIYLLLAGVKYFGTAHFYRSFDNCIDSYFLANSQTSDSCANVEPHF